MAGRGEQQMDAEKDGYRDAEMEGCRDAEMEGW